MVFGLIERHCPTLHNNWDKPSVVNGKKFFIIIIYIIYYTRHYIQ